MGRVRDAEISPSSGALNLPGGDPVVWFPISTTLIYGEHDAVLVDPPFTTDTTREVLAWLDKTGRDISKIYVTHGHGDHWLGAPVLLDRMPRRGGCSWGRREVIDAIAEKFPTGSQWVHLPVRRGNRRGSTARCRSRQTLREARRIGRRFHRASGRASVRRM
ncbi:hypothetical protein GCM10023080_096570 [Streptomyces pseudoechinosporeus]